MFKNVSCSLTKLHKCAFIVFTVGFHSKGKSVKIPYYQNSFRSMVKGFHKGLYRLFKRGKKICLSTINSNFTLKITNKDEYLRNVVSLEYSHNKMYVHF